MKRYFIKLKHKIIIRFVEKLVEKAYDYVLTRFYYYSMDEIFLKFLSIVKTLAIVFYYFLEDYPTPFSRRFYFFKYLVDPYFKKFGINDFNLIKFYYHEL